MRVDIGFISKLDVQGDREMRLRQLREDYEYKKRNEEHTKEEIMALNEKLRSLGEVNIDSITFVYEENYSSMLKDLHIGYTDIVQSMRDHLNANAAILRKEQEIKEMEARIALIDLDALDEEYNKLRIQYDRDSEILRDLEERYSLIHDRLIRLRARLREINDLLKTYEDRLETARFEIEDAERKYKLIKVPKKIEYVVNERVEDVLIKKKYLIPGEVITEEEREREKKRRSIMVVGKEFYRPSREEFDQLMPLGSIVKISESSGGMYYFGDKEVSFIKGEDGELYVSWEGYKFHIDDFLSIYEPTQRKKSNTRKAGIVEHGTIDAEEDVAEVGDEMAVWKNSKAKSNRR